MLSLRGQGFSQFAQFFRGLVSLQDYFLADDDHLNYISAAFIAGRLISIRQMAFFRHDAEFCLMLVLNNDEFPGSPFEKDLF